MNPLLKVFRIGARFSWICGMRVFVPEKNGFPRLWPKERFHVL